MQQKKSYKHKIPESIKSHLDNLVEKHYEFLALSCEDKGYEEPVEEIRRNYRGDNKRYSITVYYKFEDGNKVYYSNIKISLNSTMEL
jgi:hypothetical protein